MLKITAILCLATIFTVSCGNKKRDYRTSHDIDENEDPTYPEVSNSEKLSWIKIPVQIYFHPDMSRADRAAVAKAGDTYEKTTGMNLFEFSLDSNLKTSSIDQINKLYEPLGDNESVMYPINYWPKLSAKTQVLATTVWREGLGSTGRISQADIVFNYSNYNFVDFVDGPSKATRTVVDGLIKQNADLQMVALHELGHFLGLGHTANSEDPDSIMNPGLNLLPSKVRRVLSSADISEITARYNCSNYDCKK